MRERAISTFSSPISMRAQGALIQTADDDTALAPCATENLPHDHFIGAITRSEEGALVVTRQSTQSVKAHPVDRVDRHHRGAGDPVRC